MAPAKQVAINCAKFPIKVQVVPCNLASFGKCNTLPMNSPNRLGVAIEKAIPEKIDFTALPKGTNTMPFNKSLLASSVLNSASTNVTSG